MTERTVADRYVLSEPPIGMGGMGTVWKAYDTVLRRDVAVKELRIPDGLSPQERDTLHARALREARAAAGLDHPGIVTIHDVVDEGGQPWIVMRLLPGGSLDRTVRDGGPLSPHDAAELGAGLLDALAAAHAGGVLHRDVKPQNVMRDGGGRWLLTDFGIASVTGATRTLTGTGLVTGTLGYVAPERLSGAVPGAAADLWSLGATLYFAVEGRHAYDHDDLPAMIAAILTRDPEPPRQAGPLADVIAGLMERDPERRLTVAAAREHLLAVAGGRPVAETPTERLGVSGAGASGAGLSGGPTEKLHKPTKVLPPEKPRGGGATTGNASDRSHESRSGESRPEETRPGQTPDVVGRPRALPALGWLPAALNGAIGGLVAILAYSAQDGMPLWIAGVLGLALAVGGGLGASLLAPPLARRLGQPTALVTAALLMGGSFAGAGVMAGVAKGPVVATVLLAASFVPFGAAHRLARSMRQRVVPPALLGRVTILHQVTGFAAILLGAGAGYYLLVVQAYGPDVIHYVLGFPVTVGVVVIVAALLAIPALRAVPADYTGTVR